jgi:uncharacterized protein YndB with AHSA1/START domain
MNEPVVKSVLAKCTIHEAFQTFTARIDLWWPIAQRESHESVMVLEPWTGGAFLEKSMDGTDVRLGEIQRFEPPRTLAYTWYPGAIKEPTLVSVTFAEETDAVRVTVTHATGQSALGAEWPARAAGFQESWDVVLPTFASFLAGEGAAEEELEEL